MRETEVKQWALCSAFLKKRICEGGMNKGTQIFTTSENFLVKLSDEGNKDLSSETHVMSLFEKQKYSVSIVQNTKAQNHISHLIFGKSFDMNMFDSLNYSIIKFHSVST